MTIRGFVRLAALALLLLPAGPRAQGLNRLTEEEKRAGWVLLFDGRSNAGWETPDGSPGGFAVEDSALRTRGGDICTDKDYDHFELSLSYRYNEDGNSGVFLRTKRGVDPPWLSGMEVAIQDNGSPGRLYETGDAALYDIKAPSKDMWTGPGKWNRLRVRLVGNDLEHWHNGEKVVSLVIGSAEWDRLVRASKFSQSPFPENRWGKEAKGAICLQDHGDPQEAWFRDIKLRPLRPDGTALGPRGNGPPAPRWTGRGSGQGPVLAFAAPFDREARVALHRPDGTTALSVVLAPGAAVLPLGSLPSGLYALSLDGVPAGKFVHSRGP